ncbi:MAG: ATP-dependent DNA helicase RecG [Candidatus Omnitrophica bacterium]|nr:ATP-dependent DNA helicase RecG [Candidatus Omnitrophota bacterium]
MNIQAPVETSGIRFLKGVGPKKALLLEKFGVRSPRDLLYFFPRRYEDRSHLKTISQVLPGETITLRGKILTVKLKPMRRTRLVEVLIGDETGAIPAIWFNQPYLKNQFQPDQEVIFYGKVDLYQDRLQMISPEYELFDQDQEGIHTGRITPIYPLTEGLFQRSLRTTLREVVQTQLEKSIQEYLTPAFRKEHQLMELSEAIREMHFPSSFQKLDEARYRIVFDEFLLFEMTLLKKIEHMKSKYRASALPIASTWIEDFKKSLPFRLTAGQESALKSLVEDLGKTIPMNRLLMGDVGSGKTVIAAFAALAAVKNNYQAAVLVPTEILAEQHYRTLARFLEAFSIPVELITASTPPARRERLIAELRQSKPMLLVGTHALLQEDIRFGKLSLVIVDEQHKFGVHQRCQLLNMNPRPHQLVMTATPIPRTLALTVYGDLDVSALKELPAGRKPVKTYWITRAKQEDVLLRILQKIQKGEQAYFIFPLIEETEKSDMLAATREYERLKKSVFKDISIGLVHGRLSTEERNRSMQAFNRGEISVLVATSVIEVGVDNPNTTAIVIENAERFGLSQLHQMRGRIGRGVNPSECFLFGEPKTEEGKKRLRILTKSQDGFLIAEEDLKLRGAGDFWGTRQSGEPLFHIANPVLDYEILLKTRKIALDLIHRSARESSPEWRAIQNHLEQFPLRY